MSAARVLVTGGAGFIGTNLTARLIEQGCHVVVLDSLVRPGSDANARWLQRTYPQRFELIAADVRDRAAVFHALHDVGHVFHLAAQVAVTTSLAEPTIDFDVNARGTLVLLEAIRACRVPPSLVFTSTNKVYGGLDDIELTELSTRYVPRDGRVRDRGIGEQRALDFHSPYGCSKGAADQYVRDYARSYGLRTVVLRMSCIYGPHQNGSEDQGWVAHFVRHASTDRAVTVFGDGKQVRDVLYIDDLVNALLLARERIEPLSGRAFNIGGGPRNTVSLIELIASLEAAADVRLEVAFAGWRVGDQRYYVSDTTAFHEATGWTAAVAPSRGLAKLREWLADASMDDAAHLRPVPVAHATEARS